jgi:hypothetical protein
MPFIPYWLRDVNRALSGGDVAHFRRLDDGGGKARFGEIISDDMLSDRSRSSDSASESVEYGAAKLTDR